MSELKPISPKATVSIEESVSKDFTFELDGGQMVTDNKMGRTLNELILDNWKDKNYISGYEYVPLEKFTNSTDYTLTLKGSQTGESSIAMQVISGLTLMMIPYTVNTTMDLEYVLKNVKTGATYNSKAKETVKSWSWLLLLPALPFAGNGMATAADHIAEHVYQDFVSQGAFQN
ncbi:hypothetical protein [Methylomonas koyamae]|uniref:hypothetical protein n=1 Tax=Methylomonas koyamae TaxID=702114 RepID=UPI0018D4832B|nr:hypothetical protein [Methylomonas koyamae]